MIGLELRTWRERRFLLPEEAAQKYNIPLKQWLRWEAHPGKVIPGRVTELIKREEELEEAGASSEAR